MNQAIDKIGNYPSYDNGEQLQCRGDWMIPKQVKQINLKGNVGDRNKVVEQFVCLPGIIKFHGGIKQFLFFGYLQGTHLFS